MESRYHLRPYPVLTAFLAFLGGVLAGGCFGGVPAAVAILGLWLCAEGITRARRARPPRWAWPLAVLFSLGAVRIEKVGPSSPDWPVEILRTDSGRHARVSLEIRVENVIRRDRQATAAEVRVISFLSDGRHVEASAGTEALLVGPGPLPVLSGGTYAVRARLRAPRPLPDLLNLQWPRPRPRPTLSVSGEADIVALAGPDIPTPSRLDAWRYRLAVRILNALDEDPGDFAAAILLGEGRGVDASLRLALSRLGTAHILAVSGLHVAIAAALAGLFLVRLAAPIVVLLAPTTNLALAGLVVASSAAVGVAALAGATPSATRAAAMCGIAMASRLLGRRPRLETCAALAGLSNLVVAPKDAFTLSFLLSYSAVLGIAALHRPLARALTPARLAETRIAKSVIEGFAVSVAASLATAPLTLIAFGTAGLAAPLANLLVVPVLAFVVMPTAVVVLVAATVSPSALQALAPYAGKVFWGFLESQRYLAFFVPGPDGPLASLLFPAFCGLLVMSLAWASGARHRLCLSAGATITVLLCTVMRVGPSSGALQVTFLDVGKGDAILVRCPTGRRYLVDTGEGRSLGRLLRGLTKRGVFGLDGVLVTHGDEDHAGALLGLLNAVNVRYVAAPCPEAVRPPLAGIFESLANRGVRVTCLGLGQEALPNCGVETLVLWPPALAPLSDNAASLVLRIASDGGSILLTGDLEAEQEEILVSSGLPLESDVLKLGHHGSAGSSSAEFLQAVRPKIAIVSGHASRTTRAVPQAVLERVAEAGAMVRATEEEGDLTVLIRPNGVSILSRESPTLFFSPR